MSAKTFCKILAIWLLFTALFDSNVWAQTIKPGVGSESINLKSRMEELKKDYILKDDGTLNGLYIIADQGVEISFNGNIPKLISFSKETAATTEGVNFRTTKNTVLSVYGTSKCYQAENNIFYYEKGIGFEFENDKVCKIFVFQAQSGELYGDNIILPGIRAGEIYLNKSLSLVEKKWGDPESVTVLTGVSGGRMNFYDQTRGFIIITERNKIKSLVILTPVMATRDGLCVGLDANLISRHLGKGTKVGEQIIYKKLGISFLVKNGIIKEISLSEPSER